MATSDAATLPPKTARGSSTRARGEDRPRAGLNVMLPSAGTCSSRARTSRGCDHELWRTPEIVDGLGLHPASMLAGVWVRRIGLNFVHHIRLDLGHAFRCLRRRGRRSGPVSRRGSRGNRRASTPRRTRRARFDPCSFGNIGSRKRAARRAAAGTPPPTNTIGCGCDAGVGVTVTMRPCHSNGSPPHAWSMTLMNSSSVFPRDAWSTPHLELLDPIPRAHDRPQSSRRHVVEHCDLLRDAHRIMQRQHRGAHHHPARTVLRARRRPSSEVTAASRRRCRDARRAPGGRSRCDRPTRIVRARRRRCQSPTWDRTPERGSPWRIQRKGIGS